MKYICGTFFKHLWIDSAFVKWYMNAVNFICLVNVVDFSVARILNGITLVSSEQLNDKPVKIFRSCTDDNSVSADLHSSEAVKVIGNGLTKLMRWDSRAV